MTLILHTIAATSGLAVATYMLFAPSKTALRISYGLLGLTLTSGTLLVVSTGTHILQACLMGLFYTAFVTFGIVRTHRVLANAVR